MKVIVGLGNPGEKYAQTRHNIGFMTVDAVAGKLHAPLSQTKFQGQFGHTHCNGEQVLLLKPMTFMNRSGHAIRQLIEFYNCSHNDILIVYDDLDLPLGRLRLRMKGGPGGHNGLKSVIAHLGTQEFKRVRIGIDRPVQGDVVDYVLRPFSAEERPVVSEVVNKAAEACVAFVDQDFARVMNTFNQ